ncbi:response regulator transcription factor [Ruminococcus sp. NK3A76]|uniref:response regulator transcription factor n=1 Tax=Ruminococcus sp. NK3A76 TaxID=877411 RepID=UPI00048DC032|nr:response regulator transcription factor [Ruminococcus sp. NK3A76]
MKIIAVDDDKLVAISLKTILEATGKVEVAALGSNAEDAVRLYKEHRPDVALLDIRMGEVTGLDAAKEILALDKDARVLFLTTFSDDEYIVESLKIGAKGYILKQDFDDIVPALEAVMSGANVFGSEVTSRIPELMNSRTNTGFDFEKYDISEREQEIITLVAEGLSNKEISSKLFLSEGTVRNYLSTILEKLGLRDRTQLAVFYYKEVRG